MAAIGSEKLLPCAWLLHRLGRRCELRPANAATLASLAKLLAPTGYLALRTVSIAGAYAVATALTARAGASAAAAHQIATQVWLASSLLSDALAVAAQSLVARNLAAGRLPEARAVVNRTVRMAVALGCAMAGALALGRDAVPRAFTSDPAVLALVSGGVWGAVVATQPLNSAAFAWDGVLFGAGGFRYACIAMAAACAPAVALMAATAGGGGAAAPAVALAGVWAGLAVVMAGRWLSIAAPYAARTGPFAPLFADKAAAAAAKK
ncbi:hypothetical protein Rsub_01136 [Raphidocelis subcapitata]|uniref:Uncharacterized protein n=1 Tax=Raphidocelis subcapitata TaxID=307507 RepID=A0A2V0NLV2_9CHLO|nr:hypothetical protein Rsub_01136 [Raphidocelis subcapitata]|eukprot:GBF88424.1 hypothetical protein Rsub_01136 [Raphidocelis subcapitata]